MASATETHPDLATTMDLKQIRYFVRVAELGSLSRAAVELGVAQPTLSRKIRQLEVGLQQNLLIRTGRGVRVTDAGRVLMDHGRGILHQVERAQEDMFRVSEGLVGRVAIGLLPGLTNILTAPLVRSFYQTFPDATVSISEGLSVPMQEALIRGDLDVALLYNASPSPDIEVCPVIDQTLFFVSSPKAGIEGSSLSLDSVADNPLVIPRRPNVIRMELEAQLAAIGRRPKIAVEVDTIPGLLDLVAEGMGSAILPKTSITAYKRSREFIIRPVINPTLSVKLYYAVSARRPTTPVQRHLVKLICDLIGELIDQK